MRRDAPRGGLDVGTLRKSWAGVGAAVEELEKRGKVLVTRAGTGAEKEKDGQLKTIFFDEIGAVPAVDDEFKDIWRSLKTPDPVTLAEELAEAGLSLASANASTTAQANAGQRKKKGRKGPGAGRRLKITNTHLKDEGIDLSKDYVPQR